MDKLQKFFFISIVFLLLVGCGEKVSPVEMNIVRFDKILFSLNHEHPDIKTISSDDYPFFNMYAIGVLQMPDVNSPEFPELLSLFLTDSTINIINDSVEHAYPQMDMQERELSSAFGYYKHYFPFATLPKVYSCISGLNQSIITDSVMIGIGLDNYLGEDYIFYRLLAEPVPKYIRKKMTANHIVRDVIYGWLTASYPFHPEKLDLISGMIYQGKICYLMEKLLPAYSQERIFNFDKTQLHWCKDNEVEMWEFLLSGELIFNNTPFVLNKYLNDAPFSSGMPQESPGRAVVWSGYRIIRQYVDNSGASLSDLMQEQDYHKILRLSKYRP
ncbi:MAG: hypothetical protein LBM07_05105 [Culturomica sp.]|jgi:hypothetical protein|nr:hypothetical protein [Culturomica sp.]